MRGLWDWVGEYEAAIFACVFVAFAVRGDTWAPSWLYAASATGFALKFIRDQIRR